MGFLPFLGNAAMAFAPSLLNSLFGGQDPGKQYRTRVAGLLAPQNMGRLTQQYFQQALGSPAYAQGQRQIAQGANQTGNMLQQRAAQAGIGGSGLGALMSSLTPSISGNALAQLQAGAYQGAQGQAQNSIQQQLGAMGQTGQPWAFGPSQNQEMFSGGLAALGPLLEQFFKSRQGGMPKAQVQPSYHPNPPMPNPFGN